MSGRSPKLVAAEVGHTSTRMVTEVYDAFVDPSCWPNESERRKLAKVYGWELTAPDGRVIWTPDTTASERPERPPQLLSEETRTGIRRCLPWAPPWAPLDTL